MDLEKAAKRISSLKTFNPNHKWSSQDKLLHELKKGHLYANKNIAFRRNLLESQLRVNYVNEFDRLKGHLYANKNLPAPTKDHIKDRLKNLQKLARQSLYGKDNLYEDNVDSYKV